MCCLFGLLDTRRRLSGKQKSAMLHVLATLAESRGTDATGVAYNDAGKLVIRKAPVPGRAFKFNVPDTAIVCMGHARMTTQGNEKTNRNNHPFRGKAAKRPFALAHNGILHNDEKLRQRLKLPSTKIETDSYIAVQLVQQQGILDFSSLKYMAELVEGSFTFTVLDADDSLYVVKGDSPLCLYHFPKLGLYVYASTEEILLTALNAVRLPLQWAVEIEFGCGEILKIDRTGEITRDKFDDAKLRGYSIWYPGGNQTYLDDLRSVAAWVGYPPELIDHCIARGCLPDEIEDLLDHCIEGNCPPEEIDALLYEGEV